MPPRSSWRYAVEHTRSEDLTRNHTMACPTRWDNRELEIHFCGETEPFVEGQTSPTSCNSLTVYVVDLTRRDNTPAGTYICLPFPLPSLHCAGALKRQKFFTRPSSFAPRSEPIIRRARWQNSGCRLQRKLCPCSGASALLALRHAHGRRQRTSALKTPGAFSHATAR